ncbi:MAG: four helix bundle protein [Minisyncoccales bacterium]
MDNNYGFRFREWNIYNDARKFKREIYLIVNKFPRDEKFGIIDQAKRASVSIVLNIAESANKNTDRDMRLYINRAHCSLDEVVACADCALDENFIDNSIHQRILEMASNLAKRLNGFTKYLSK